MLRTWNENRGTRDTPSNPEEPVIEAAHLNPDLEHSPKSAVQDAAQQQSETGTKSSLRDVRVWTLSFVSCCFEGTIFLLMYFWPGALQEAHSRGGDAHSDGADGESGGDSGVSAAEADSEAYSVPYGVTFACFMATMVLGGLLFNALVRRRHHLQNGQYESLAADIPADHISRHSNIVAEDRKTHEESPESTRYEHYHALGQDAVSALANTLTPTRLLSLALLLAGASFLAAALARAELPLFAAFLVLEFCNGVYVPSMALHRSAVVGEAGRASVYAVMNVPLFVFVVVALCTSTTSGRGGKSLSLFLFFSPPFSMGRVQQLTRTPPPQENTGR